MKKPILLLGITLFVSVAAFIVACSGVAKNDVPSNNNSPVVVSPKKGFKVEFKSDPAGIQAGSTAILVLVVKDEQGAVVKDLQIVHEKLMHLLVVSKDLAEFYHIHPEIQADGSFKVEHIFPNGGAYRLYVDITPKDSAQVVEQIDVKVGGTERPKATLIADTKFEKTVDGLRVAMSPNVKIQSGKELELNFKAFDATSGKPATDLQKYLGATAHFVIISQDLMDYLHVHPMEKGESMDAMKMDGQMSDDHAKDDQDNPSMMKADIKSVSPEIMAHTTFPRAGMYKLWAQFQRGGKVIVVPFVLQVPESTQTKSTNRVSVPRDAIRITVSGEGYKPASVAVKNGQLVRLAFHRLDDNNCGDEVIFPKLNIRETLPVGETVIVEFTPTETGDMEFLCGMGMLTGKVVVN